MNLLLSIVLFVTGLVLVTTAAMLAKSVSRWTGATLVLLYLVFAIGGYAGGELPRLE